MSRVLLILAALAAPLGVGLNDAKADGGVVVHVAPPAPREVLPEARYGYDSFDSYDGSGYRGSVRGQGHWPSSRYDWERTDGYWTEARPGYVWIDGFWDTRDYHCHYGSPGRWGRIRAGHRWRPGRWSRGGNTWRWDR